MAAVRFAINDAHGVGKIGENDASKVALFLRWTVKSIPLIGMNPVAGERIVAAGDLLNATGACRGGRSGASPMFVQRLSEPCMSLRGESTRYSGAIAGLARRARSKACFASSTRPSFCSASARVSHAPA